MAQPLKTATLLLHQVTCWQQRIDPNTEVTLKKKKQRPVSIAGEVTEAYSQLGLKRVPSMGALPLPERVIILPRPPTYDPTLCCENQPSLSLLCSIIFLFETHIYRHLFFIRKLILMEKNKQIETFLLGFHNRYFVLTPVFLSHTRIPNVRYHFCTWGKKV